VVLLLLAWRSWQLPGWIGEDVVKFPFVVALLSAVTSTHAPVPALQTTSPAMFQVSEPRGTGIDTLVPEPMLGFHIRYI